MNDAFKFYIDVFKTSSGFVWLATYLLQQQQKKQLQAGNNNNVLKAYFVREVKYLTKLNCALNFNNNKVNE